MTNLQVIQELYRAFREKDYDAFLDVCTSDLEWIQNAGFPGGATYQGAETVVEGVFKPHDKQWEMFSFRIDRYLDARDSVIVIGALISLVIASRKSRFKQPQRTSTILSMVRCAASALQIQKQFGMQWRKLIFIYPSISSALDLNKRAKGRDNLLSSPTFP